mmetsp:Transcript_21951/g.10326  ORF Transcript_21951/g.10326 Transcript_21951/m.10326 type:complete len:139 (+) Transcript_21951:1432-1848(+)|eukprot:CAMPEP_0201282244 /NCGR_PEP_ID=MMETSP1317-20130820/5127_1 /ASSEMBLY_ACC=CAM_ASM_000770 /TAXON_ID=187299 /ORGANISM="Undescribed Undescribed, Strain Undescribed" /LENGTH=138 /DNA_ID=CAMNT_0047594335 /DNA_START=521 /DNA_END=937 /DNA_ORIENTATION=-
MENIRFGKEDATDEEVYDAAEKAFAHEFILNMEEPEVKGERKGGYDTNVGAMGNRISGGQKQRIAIARAIIRDPKVLLLDEATSALDREAEQEVQQAINSVSHGRTVLVVAHRLSTIRDSHKIGVIKEGNIVEIGTHD